MAHEASDVDERHREWHVERIQRCWREIESHIQSHIHAGPRAVKVLRLYHEDLASAPAAVLLQVCTFLGLGHDASAEHELPAMLRRAARSAPARPAREPGQVSLPPAGAAGAGAGAGGCVQRFRVRALDGSETNALAVDAPAATN